MRRAFFRRVCRQAGFRCRLLAGAALLGIAFWPSASDALTPKSPEVKDAVAKACGYLAKNHEGRNGGKVLVGLTFLKAEQPTHARVQEAITAANQVVSNPAFYDVYTNGLTLIFLSEVVGSAPPIVPKEQQAQYAQSINTLLAHMKDIQKPEGGWGYPEFKTGDTSMTQYGMLGMWSAEAAGFDTPLECWEKVINWTMRTQSPEGAFGYQGKDPGNFTPIAQERTTLSICAAGSGCLYMGADFLGLLDEKQNQESDDAILKKVKKEGVGRKGKETSAVDRAMLWERIRKADAHMDAAFLPHAPEYSYYYLYAFERYKTFKDYAEGNLDKEVDWYTQCAKSVISLQEQDGHWKNTYHGIGDVCDTCFATLFLLRSMYKKVAEIKRLQGGLAHGGRGLPSSDSEVEMQGGQVKRKPLKGPAEELLAMLGNPEEAERALDGLSGKSLAGEEDHMSEIQKRVRKMFAEAKTSEERVGAVTVLARTRDLAQVPVLLEALKDPDPAVFVAADNGLRFMSRKFASPNFFDGVPDDATRKEAQRFWTDWYKSLEPDVELDE